MEGVEGVDSSLDDVAEDEDSENDEEIPESIVEEVFMKALSILKYPENISQVELSCPE